MTDLLLETHDRFVVLYDLLELIKEGVTAEAALASSLRVSHKVISEILALIILQGYAKTAENNDEFQITMLGSKFLRDFKGMRGFLS